MNEVKSFTPIDLPLFRRLASQGLSLDIAAHVQDINPLENAVLGVVAITGRGRPTYILRTGDGDFAAQMQVDDTHARLTLLAPNPAGSHTNSAWLTLLDSMTEQAGRRGAHFVTAEVPVDSEVFELCRRAGFTVYSRQNLHYLERVADPPTELSGEFTLRSPKLMDDSRLHALYTNIVPKIVQQVLPAPHDWNGLAVVQENRLRGFIGIQENKKSIILHPYFHPELYDHVEEVFQMVMAQLPGDRALYVHLLAYQEWLRNALETNLGFAEYGRYALMARHTTVTLKESSVFSALTALDAMSLVPGVEAKLEQARSGSQLMIKNLVRWDTELPTTSKN